MNPAELRRLAQFAEHMLHLKANQRLLRRTFPLIGIGTRLLSTSVIMPRYRTAAVDAVTLERRLMVMEKRQAASARKSRGQLRLVYSRPSP